MSWFSRPGDANANSFQQNPNPKSLWTFYLKTGEKKNLLFLDDAQFAVWEAKVRVNGNWQRFTADTSNPEDPLVVAAASKKIYLSLVEYYTVLDLTPYKAKDGTERKFSKRALAVPKTMQEMIARRRGEVGGNLMGAMFTVVRDGEKSAACGNDWSFQKKVDLQKEVSSGKLTAEVVKSYDFTELLKPSNAGVVRAALSSMLGSVPEPETISRESLRDPFASDEPVSSNTAESDIPF